MLRITNPHDCFHLRRTSEPLKSQGINPILDMGMTSHKTLPRWCLRGQPSGSAGMPLISPTPSRSAFLHLEAGTEERSGVIAPHIVAAPSSKVSRS